MAKKILKSAGIVLGVIVFLLAGFVAWAFSVTKQRTSRSYNVAPVHFSMDIAKADVAKGEHLVRVRLACVECHGDDLSGGTVMEDPGAGHVYGSNITPAALKDWTNEEIARAIRDGVDKTGRPIIIMPAQDLQHLSEEDMLDVIAYLRSVPAVDKPSKGAHLGPVIKILYALDKVPTVTPALVVEHGKPFPPAVPEKISPAFGEYIAKTSCLGCHGENLQGGKIPGGPPNWPPAANITADALGAWGEEGFVKTLRTGVNPSGDKLRKPMLTRYTAHYTDAELKSLWAYISARSGSDNF